MVDEGERGIKRQGERGLKDERRRGGRRTSRSCRRRWRLLCTGRCSVSTRNRTGEEGEDTQRADGAKEEKKRKDRRREGRGETGGLVAATLRYDSRLSYPPHYLVLLPSLPPPFLPMLLLVPVSTPPSLRTNPSSPAQRRLSPLSADPRSAPTTSCLDGAYTDAANFAHRRTLARATVSCDSPSLSVRQSSLFHTTPISLTQPLRSAFFSFHGVCLFLTFSHRRVLSRVHTHGPDTRAPLGSLASDKATAAIVAVAVVTDDVVGASIPMRLCAIATRGLIWYVHAVWYGEQKIERDSWWYIRYERRANHRPRLAVVLIATLPLGKQTRGSERESLTVPRKCSSYWSRLAFSRAEQLQRRETNEEKSLPGSL